MKLFVFFLVLFISLSFAFQPLHKQPNSLFNLAKIRNEAKLQIEYNFLFPFDTFRENNSTCGDVNCTSVSDCPNFAFLDEYCLNGFCEYQEVSDQNVCPTPSECGTNTCDCSTTASDGCKCASNSTCSSYSCYSGICQNNHGYLGEFCTSDDDCGRGGCNKTNKCEFVPLGGSCGADWYCDTTAYCDDGKCTMRPDCNDTIDFDIGYCPNLGICWQGTCFPLLQGQLGDECVAAINCEPGLACLNATGTIMTCQRVPLGTPCTDDDQCEIYTQQCLCTQPDNSFPMTCSDPGMQMCKDEFIDLVNCQIEYRCDLYDIYDPSTDCGKHCMEKQNIADCCTICLYPEQADNAYINVAGFCANDTLTVVNCCSSTIPCSITPTYQLCLGYSELKKKK